MRPFTLVLFIASIGMSSALTLPGGETADDSDTAAAGDIGDIIPADRRIDWTHSTGVPGGIPEWTRVCGIIDAATYGGGAIDATAAIQAAVNACVTSAPGSDPGPGVISIPPGTYRLDGSVNLRRSYTVIRGAGADQTTFVAGGQAFSVGSNGLAFKDIGITAGATKGSTELTLADISDLAVGQLIVVSADNEPGLVYASHNSKHDSKQMALITAIDGNTLTVTPPLIWSFAPNPVVLYSFIGIIRFVGLEDMKVDHAQGKGGASFMIDQCYGCWVRGMASYKPGGYHTYILDSLLGEVRDSYFLDSQTYGSNNAGLNVRGTTNGGVNQGAVTGFKFENNIFDKTFPGVELQNASSGNYVGYNYGYATQAGVHEPGDTYVAWNTGMFNDNHGPHDMMNLWEGNTGEQFTSDGYFGSASHGTLFRNHLTGVNPRFGVAWSAISLNRWSYHYNVVGNVLGTLSPATASYEFGDTASCYAGKGIYRLGFPNTGNCSLTPFDGANPPGIDNTVITTLLRWGNFDTKHNAAVWDAMEIPSGVPVPATQSLPASIYYERKPSWWPSAVAWPPIGPDVTGGELLAGHAWKIPAQRCYESQNLGDGGAFSRATCYGQEEAPGDRIYLPTLVALGMSTVATMGSGDAATDATEYELVGQIGGAEISFSNTLALGEGHLYLGLGPRLAVVDISDPAHPRVIGQSEILPRAVRGLIARDGRAYVALADGGVAVVDVSNPQRPQVIGRARTGTDAQALALNGHILYVTVNDEHDKDSQLLVFDIADPGNFVAKGRMDLAGKCRSIVTRGEFAYVGCSYSGLAVVNITNAGQPVLAGILPKRGEHRDVDLLGPYVVFPGQGELDIVDVTDPREPQSIAHQTLPDITHGVTVVGDRIYIGYYQGIDEARFQVMDASVPTAPRVISSFKTSGLPLDLVADDGNAYVTYWQKRQPGSAYLGVLDLSDPAEPKEIGALDAVGEVQIVTVQGHVAFAGKNDSVGPSRLHAIDVTDPAQPQLLSTYPGELTELWKAVASDAFLYAADEIGGLRVIDISDPRRMRETGQISFGSDKALDVAVGGDLAYVGISSGALNLVDVADKEHPVLVGRLPLEDTVWTVAVDGDTAYVGVGDDGLRIVDVSDPVAPAVVASVPWAGRISDIALRGNLAYVYGNGLTILDVAVPSQPQVLSVTPIGYSSWGMAVDGERLYVAEQSNANRWQAGFRAYDVSDPAAVREIAVVDAPGESWGIAAADGIVYLADHFTGLSIFRGVEAGRSPTAPVPVTPAPVPVGWRLYIPSLCRDCLALRGQAHDSFERSDVWREASKSRN